MNFVDILIWVVLLFFAVKGFMKGLVREVCSLLGLVVGAWAAFAYFRPAAEVVGSRLHLPGNVASLFSFALIFLAFALLFFFLGHLLTTLFKIILMGGLNRMGGIVIGVLQALLVLCVILSPGTLKLMPAGMRAHVEASASARPLTACGNEVWSWWKSGKVSGKKAEPVKSSSRSDADLARFGKTPERRDIR